MRKAELAATQPTQASPSSWVCKRGISNEKRVFNPKARGALHTVPQNVASDQPGGANNQKMSVSRRCEL